MPLTFSTSDGVTLHPEAANVTAPRVLALRGRLVGHMDVIPPLRRRQEARAGLRGRRGARRMPRVIDSGGFVREVRVTFDRGVCTFVVDIVAKPIVCGVVVDADEAERNRWRRVGDLMREMSAQAPSREPWL